MSDNIEQHGDLVGGDKLGGDKVGRDKIINNFPASLPLPDPLVAAQALLALMPRDIIPEPVALPPGSRMPYAHNPLFVGREDDLKAIAAALHSGTIAAIGQVAAATGLGGIGKTQLAAEFAHRYGQFFAGGILWLSFADAASVPSEIAQCGRAGAMNLPAFNALTFDDQVASVRQAWQSALPRLLIFDNCEDEDLLAAWCPTTGGSRVLLTSRRAQWDASLAVQALPLATLLRAESIVLLRKLIGDTPALKPDPRNPTPDPLDSIAAELGDLPLALHLAGSFLKQYRADITPVGYLAELRSAPLLDHDSLQGIDLTISPTNHDLHVGRTFALSYQRLDRAKAVDALASQLLARAACFALGEPLPRDLLLASVELPDTAAHRRASRAITRLVALGLLDVERDDALRLHRLLGVFVGALAADAAALSAVEQALLDTANRLNNAGYPAPLLAIQIHLRIVTERASARADERAAGLCNTLAYHLQMIGDLEGARPYYEQALAIRKEVLGERHPDTARSLNNLGTLLQEGGDLEGARPYFEQALAIYREMLGERHPATARSLNNLGALLQEGGDLEGARPYFEQALAIKKEVLGERHPDTAMSLNNLGTLLQDIGDLVGARPYYEQALAIYREMLGERHPDTAMSLNNLGALLHDIGDLEGARPYFEQALAIYREMLGERHPDTARSLNNLGALLQEGGDLEGARPYFEQALAIGKEVLGERHPATARSLNNLGALLLAQGDLERARPYFEQALAIGKEVLGERHPDTARSLNNLGALLQEGGGLEGARPYFEQALAIREVALGLHHPDTAQSLWCIGTLHAQEGDRDGAREHLQRAVVIYTRALGEHHPTTQQCQRQLAALDALPPSAVQ